MERRKDFRTWKHPKRLKEERFSGQKTSFFCEKVETNSGYIGLKVETNSGQKVETFSCEAKMLVRQMG